MCKIEYLSQNPNFRYQYIPHSQGPGMNQCAVIAKDHQSNCSEKKPPNSNSQFFRQIKIKRSLFLIVTALQVLAASATIGTNIITEQQTLVGLTPALTSIDNVMLTPAANKPSGTLSSSSSWLVKWRTMANRLADAIGSSILLRKRSIATSNAPANRSFVAEIDISNTLPTSTNTVDSSRTAFSVSEFARSTSEIAKTNVEIKAAPNPSRNTDRIASDVVNRSSVHFAIESTQASFTFDSRTGLLANGSEPFDEKNEQGSTARRDMASREVPVETSPPGKRINQYNSSARGSCGLPVYNNRVACMSQDFFVDPIAKCEYEFGYILFTILVGVTAAAIVFVNSLILAVVVTNSKMRTPYCYIKGMLYLFPETVIDEVGY